VGKVNWEVVKGGKDEEGENSSRANGSGEIERMEE
jgi:hypothetical protein